MLSVPQDLATALAGRYTLEREIGRGGNAVVFLAHDEKHDRPVALKVIIPELAQGVRSERFLREIQIAAKLTHPHILPLHDSGSVDSVLYYVMPYIKGKSLRERLDRETQLPLEDALRITRDVAAALGHAHEHGVVHRDIKPENILLDNSGEAIVADFGIARALTVAGGQTVTETGVAVGTPAYMSPEQATGRSEIDQRSDIYSLGCVLYEMLAGRAPFTGVTAQEVLARHALDPVPSLTAARPGMPEVVQKVVVKALAKAPVDRFADAGALIAALSAEPASAAARGERRGWKRAATIAALGVLVVSGWLSVRRRATSAARYDAHWVHEVAIPLIERLAEDGQTDSAWRIARRAATILPDDSILESLWPRFAWKVSIPSNPPGATLYRNTYTADHQWESLGSTPVQQIWLPEGDFRLRFVKPGYDTLEIAFYNVGEGRNFRPGWATSTDFRLFPRGVLPAGMVHVSGGGLYALHSDLAHMQPAMLGEFLIDKYEVTNREYQQFVLAGGYRNSRYWQEPFVRDGRQVLRDDALRRFVDRTGRPGPATWEAGDYPPGQGDLPVGGLSWYEAAAYARFAGKSLPTVYHWFKAANPRAGAWIVPHSNFGQQGPARAGTYQGLSDPGTYDMAGNVREWCSNESAGQRYILGGGWNDAEYNFNQPFAQSPWDRSATNGLRLVRYLDPPDPGAAARPLRLQVRDFMAETPVNNEVFGYYRRLLQYDSLPLDPVVQSVDSSGPDWIEEHVSFTAAYGRERMGAILFLPRHAQPPFQTVVFFPGSNALFQRTYDQRYTTMIDFLIKSGRAVVYPIYKGMYERRDEDNPGGLDYLIPDMTHAYRDIVIMWAKDVKRAIDYAASRPELDSRKVAYFGQSLGGQMAPIMLATEPRVRVAVLNLAGLRVQRPQPEVDVVNYISRVTIPTLLLSGQYDYHYPLGTSAVPFFRLLGTPAEQKRHVVVQGAHLVPRAQLMRETLDWLDHYLGPVQLVRSPR